MPWDWDCEYALEKCPSYKEKKCESPKFKFVELWDWLTYTERTR